MTHAIHYVREWFRPACLTWTAAVAASAPSGGSTPTPGASSTSDPACRSVSFAGALAGSIPRSPLSSSSPSTNPRDDQCRSQEALPGRDLLLGCSRRHRYQGRGVHRQLRVPRGDHQQREPAVCRRVEIDKAADIPVRWRHAIPYGDDRNDERICLAYFDNQPAAEELRERP